MSTDLLDSTRRPLRTKRRQLPSSLQCNRQHGSTSSCESKSEKCVKWEIGELKIGGLLGKGSVGSVHVVTAPNGSKYALKRVSKKSMKHSQDRYLKSEENLLKRANHPFIIKLFQTFTSPFGDVSFLLELCSGGELFYLLQARNVFDFATTRFYAASVVLMLGHLHERGIIFRDLKLENLMLDARGYLKLVDFGFAKQIGPLDRAYTRCGTPDYQAPEIIEGKGYGLGVDWWAFGVIVYEMSCGCPPFSGPDNLTTYSNIVRKPLRFRMYGTRIRKDARDFIKGLLTKNPDRRLGRVEGSMEIRGHGFFSGINFGDLESLKITPPSTQIRPTPPLNPKPRSPATATQKKVDPKPCATADDDDCDLDINDYLLFREVPSDRSKLGNPGVSSLEAFLFAFFLTIALVVGVTAACGQDGVVVVVDALTLRRAWVVGMVAGLAVETYWFVRRAAEGMC